MIFDPFPQTGRPLRDTGPPAALKGNIHVVTSEVGPSRSMVGHDVPKEDGKQKILLSRWQVR
jgi:hypothetical protein